jgi:hypothetical protein
MKQGNHTLRVGAFGRTQWGRRFVTPLVLLAFFLQSLVVQSHVHFAVPASSGAVSIAAVAGDAHHHDTAKDSGSQDRCPWCQAVLSSGYYLVVATAPIHLPVEIRLADALSFTALAPRSAAPHPWQSRAPPA